MHGVRAPLPVLAILLVLAASFAPTAPASHGDGDYEIPLFFERTTMDLQVLIVPPGHGQLRNNDDILDDPDPAELHPCTMAWTRAMRDAITSWEIAIDQFAATWLRDGLELTVNVLGCDDPTGIRHAPDIIVATDETMGPVLGISIATAGQVPDGPENCLVVNSVLNYKFARHANYEDMFNVAGHEFGHCLGLGHTGEPDSAPGNPPHPAHDLMEGGYEHAYGSAGTHRHCVSNLNVKGLEAVFDSVRDRFEVVRMPAADYALATNPLCDSGIQPGGE